MKVAEFLRRFDVKHVPEVDLDYDRDHSLRSLARQHATRPKGMHTGTAFDWEDLERYQQELDRLDREGAARGGAV